VDLSKVLTSSVLGDDDEVTEERYGEKKIDLTDILSRIKRNTDTARTRVHEVAEPASEGPAPETAETGASVPRSRPAAQTRRGPAVVAGTPFKAGDRVSHPKFGVGVVVRITDGDDPRLTVAFPKLGVKELAAAYAPLERA